MRPDPSGAAATSVARAFGRLNDREAALAATRTGLRFNPQLDASARIGLASALIEMQALAEGEEILQGAERTGRLSAEDTRQVAFLRETTATSCAGQRLVQEDVDGARAELLPHLRGPVASPQVLTALMRTHTRMREYPEAMRIAQELLSRDPLDGNIRASAVDLAVEMKEYGRAEALLAEGRRFEASSVDLLRAEARVARARNNPVRELRALEAATRLRMEQLRLSGQAQQAALAGEFVSPNRAGAQKLTDVADPATVGLLRQLSLARDEAAGWIQAGIGLNSRTGAAGISRSTTITTPLEASLPVPGLQGRLAVHTGTVTMIPGAISTDALSLRQFGTNPWRGPVSRAGRRRTGPASRWAFPTRRSGCGPTSAPRRSASGAPTSSAVSRCRCPGRPRVPAADRGAPLHQRHAAVLWRPARPALRP
jgi:tetratricopeptide (TPR) repeat protein